MLRLIMPACALLLGCSSAMAASCESGQRMTITGMTAGAVPKDGGWTIKVRGAACDVDRVIVKAPQIPPSCKTSRVPITASGKLVILEPYVPSDLEADTVRCGS